MSHNKEGNRTVKQITRETLQKVASQTGLKESTVQDLFLSGWAYTEAIDCLPKWQRPGPDVAKNG